MGREIKFRAWDTSDHIWLQTDINYLRLDGQCLLDANQWPWNVPGRGIIEQFTGLRDKNGKEIFEGDIIRIGDDGFEQSIGMVLYCDGAYEVCRSEISGYITRLCSCPLNLCEIIGNVHENSELLKP